VTKAVGLISGGLDSILAAKIILEQGIAVLAVTFRTPFFDHKNAARAAYGLQIPLRVSDITEPHLDIVRYPKYGYGKHMNPCIDCHALMVREAGTVMEEIGGDFLFTGEVLGQRPMSQNKEALKRVEAESGYVGRVLRPLSAKLLPETIPEKEGKVDREQFLGIRGRSRKTQMELARRYNITEYATPAGGCLLTDPIFSRRLADLFQHQRSVEIRDVELLKVGRHLRLSPEVKAVVGRDAEDNERILQMIVTGDHVLRVEGFPGPVLLIPSSGAAKDIKTAASICVRYSDAPKDEAVTVVLKRDGKEERMKAQSCPISLPQDLMI